MSVGPIRGQFDAKISMTDQDPYNSYKLVVEGSGPSGFVNGEAFISLIPNGETTTVAVEGDSRPGGLLARVGQRMMESVARSTMDRFFACLSESAESAEKPRKPELVVRPVRGFALKRPIPTVNRVSPVPLNVPRVGIGEIGFVGGYLGHRETLGGTIK